MLLCKGSPNLTEKEGYDIYLFTTHRGKTSKGKELYRKEIYLKKGDNIYSESCKKIDLGIFENIKKCFKQKKNETEHDFKVRVMESTNNLVYKFHKEIWWEHLWGII